MNTANASKKLCKMFIVGLSWFASKIVFRLNNWPLAAAVSFGFWICCGKVLAEKAKRKQAQKQVEWFLVIAADKWNVCTQISVCRLWRRWRASNAACCIITKKGEIVYYWMEKDQDTNNIIWHSHQEQMQQPHRCIWSWRSTIHRHVLRPVVCQRCIRSKHDCDIGRAVWDHRKSHDWFSSRIFPSTEMDLCVFRAVWQRVDVLPPLRRVDRTRRERTTSGFKGHGRYCYADAPSK